MIIRTTKLADGAILDIVGTLLGRFSAAGAILNLPLGTNIRISSQKGIDEYPYGRDKRNIESLVFNFENNPKDVVVFARGILDETVEWRNLSNRHGTNFCGWRSSSSYFDEFAFLSNPGSGYQIDSPLSDEDKIFVSELLNDQAASIQSGSDDEVRQFSSAISQQIDELRRLNLSMTKDLAAARREAEASVEKYRQGVDEKYEQKLREFEQAEKDLEKRRSELNDREPQHERRRIRELLTGRLHSSVYNNSVNSMTKEDFSYWLYLFLSATLLYLSFTFGQFIAQTANVTAMYIISFKSLALGGAGIAFAWAGLSGLRNSAVAYRHKNESIQKYSFDMDRASWIVETILQMNETEGKAIPSEWLQGVCRDLFTSEESNIDGNRSLESLAALLDATAHARFGTNGVEFEIDRKGAKKLAGA